jgi:Tol biopolymer transport system component
LKDSVELRPRVFGWADGSTGRWSPSSKQIVYMASAEDEKTVIATDLLIINADGTDRMRLTNTPDIIEASPTWSPDGTEIAYTDYKTSKIFVMRVK